MKRRLFVSLLIILIALSLPITVFAQDYYFSLDKMTVDVYWNADGTSSLDYRLTFSNQPGGHAIEFVDVGMPNSNFSLSDVQAEINGQRLNISSDFQGSGSSGFAVEMGSNAIPPGGTGTVSPKSAIGNSKSGLCSAHDPSRQTGWEMNECSMGKTQAADVAAAA